MGNHELFNDPGDPMVESLRIPVRRLNLRSRGQHDVSSLADSSIPSSPPTAAKPENLNPHTHSPSLQLAFAGFEPDEAAFEAPMLDSDE